MHQSKSTNMDAAAHSQLSDILNPSHKIIPWLNIYCTHNYLILPSTMLNEIPEAYKKDAVDYLCTKMRVVFDHIIQGTQTGVNVAFQQFQNSSPNIRDLCASIKTECFGSLFNNQDQIKNRCFSSLKATLSKYTSDPITVTALWSLGLEKIKIYLEELFINMIDEFNPPADNIYGYVGDQQDLMWKEVLKELLQIKWRSMWKESNVIRVYTMALETTSAIFQDQEIVKNLLINSFTKHIDPTNQLDFTGELTLDISNEELSFLMDQARYKGPSYAAAMYVAFKKQSTYTELKKFVSMKNKIDQEDKNTLKNLSKNKGEAEATRMYQDFLQKRADKQSFKDYVDNTYNIADILKEFCIDQDRAKRLPQANSAKTTKKKKQQDNKSVKKGYAHADDPTNALTSEKNDDTTRALTSETNIDYLQTEESNRLDPDRYAYHFRVKKWEQNPTKLLQYFQGVPTTSPDAKYKTVNNTLERVKEEKFRHDLRPVGQVISQADGNHYFFTLGQSNTQSALAILSDGNGITQEGVVDIGIKTINGQQMIYHQLFRRAKLETLFQRPSIGAFEAQEEQGGWEYVFDSNRKLYHKDDAYIVHIKGDNKFLRLLRWKK